MLRFQNETAGVLNEQKAVSSNFIQFHFCMKGRGDFLFNNGNYKFPVEEEHNILLFNPQQDLPINLQLESNSWMVSVLISIKKFHSLFSQDADHIHFLSPENSSKILRYSHYLSFYGGCFKSNFKCQCAPKYAGTLPKGESI